MTNIEHTFSQVCYFMTIVGIVIVRIPVFNNYILSSSVGLAQFNTKLDTGIRQLHKVHCRYRSNFLLGQLLLTMSMFFKIEQQFVQHFSIVYVLPLPKSQSHYDNF